jgi:hypothetical protein
VGKDGRITPAWYRYFVGTDNDIQAGEIQAGAGLEGGGQVSGGVELEIAGNGVTNAMLRDSLPCSVVGRFQDSIGDPADIQAMANDRVLMRDGDLLVFRLPKAAIYTVATLPSAVLAGAGTLVFVTDEAGGATLASSDGTDWRRAADRAVVS